MNSKKIDSDTVNKLRHLYFGNKKHSNYQPVPPSIAEYFKDVVLDPKWRHPGPRIRLLLENFSLSTPTEVIEIGSNTGYQSLELSRNFPEVNFFCFEISPQHVEFARLCAKIEGLTNVKFINKEFDPAVAQSASPQATILDFNVVHHAGEDFFRSRSVDSNIWWTHVLPIWLSGVSSYSSYWFSTGFRLNGRRELPLADPETPSKLILKILEVQQSVAPRAQADVYVVSLDESGIGLNYRKIAKDELSEIDSQLNHLRTSHQYAGEFFSRPIFHFRHE